ncbi:hypothetical protein QBC37DRAFT_421367 [Rhypophila decipiens]|uniref:COP9 signalosome complex subunit 6 n=1 Tax=Rhypophila decipiens TaxID=261697 RepID=A0AAN6Y9H1_9PEZI|nr:hypothetical protein QBC37DRAFT_421367 [Rhypophila decipiens]
MAGETVNPLMSVQRSSDSGRQVVLHPLPLLEISDFITRSYQRGFKGAIVGGLIGSQNGRQITIEHSFACHTKKNDAGEYELDETWFSRRLDSMRLVHKAPQLDLVGWYALVPKSGPTAKHLPIFSQILARDESAILLGFHIDHVLRPTPGDPLPLTIYEASLEADDGSGGGGGADEDKEMKDSGTTDTRVLKFRELPYTTETGETEMIALQFIREGGAHGAAAGATERILEQFDKKIAVTDGGKGKRRAVTQGGQSSSKGKGPDESSSAAGAGATTATSKDANLTKSEAEYMSALQAKLNAIKMMKSRVDLVVAYLEKLPPGFVAGTTQTPEQAAAEAAAAGGKYTTPSNNILRQIQALVTNIELATPAQKNTLAKEMLQETNDVNLIALISDLVTSVSEVREAGKKFAVVESARNHKARSGQQSSYEEHGYGRGPGLAELL